MCAEFPLRKREHPGVEICCDKSRRWSEPVAQPARENACSAGQLQNVLGLLALQTRGHVHCEWLEKSWTQIAIVIFGNRTLEDDVWIALHKLGMRSANESLSTARQMAFHQSS